MGGAYFKPSNLITNRSKKPPNLDITNLQNFPPPEHYDPNLISPNLIPYKPSYVKPLYQVYNKYMSPRHHFADYAKRDPKGYRAFSDNLWNSFVGVTHTIGLGHFFTFTPDFLGADEVDQAAGRFAQGEIPGDQDQTI